MAPTALLWKGGNTLWIGLILDPEHGWKWINGRPYRYMKWDSGDIIYSNRLLAKQLFKLA